MLYVDQPIGTGFSYGTDDATSTVTAAPFVWKLMQAFYEAFPTYENRDFGLWTESYGGHYGPEFAGKTRQASIEFPRPPEPSRSICSFHVGRDWTEVPLPILRGKRLGPGSPYGLATAS